MSRGHLYKAVVGDTIELPCKVQNLGECGAAIATAHIILYSNPHNEYATFFISPTIRTHTHTHRLFCSALATWRQRADRRPSEDHARQSLPDRRRLQSTDWRRADAGRRRLHLPDRRPGDARPGAHRRDIG